MTTSRRSRSELVEALQADLVGPFLPAGHPGSGEEVLPLVPSRWHLTGFLASHPNCEAELHNPERSGTTPKALAKAPLDNGAWGSLF